MKMAFNVQTLGQFVDSYHHCSCGNNRNNSDNHSYDNCFEYISISPIPKLLGITKY